MNGISRAIASESPVALQAWGSFLAAWDQGANIAIAIAFLLLPVPILLLWKARRRDLPHAHVLPVMSMALFISGIGHFNDAVSFHWSAPRWFTLVDLVTAVVSLICLAILPGIIKKARTLPTLEDYRRLNERLRDQNREKERDRLRLTARNASLKGQIGQIEDTLQAKIWLIEREEALNLLKTMLLTIQEQRHGT